jgi:hypothetical protein
MDGARLILLFIADLWSGLRAIPARHTKTSGLWKTAAEAAADEEP